MSDAIFPVILNVTICPADKVAAVAKPKPGSVSKKYSAATRLGMEPGGGAAM